MSRPPVRLTCLLALLLPGVAVALEVGPLQVLSAPGQPLMAHIVVGGTPQELAELSAQPASAELYARAGQTRSAFAAGVVPSLERGGPELVLIQLRSTVPVPPGQSVLLLDLRWPGGSLVRGYAFALDGSPVEPVRLPAPGPAVAPPATPRSPSASADYLTQPGDSLGSVAQRHGEPGQIRRWMGALYALNREQFVDGDPARLRTGARLRLPDAAELARTAPLVPTAPPAAPAAVPMPPSTPATAPAENQGEGPARLQIGAGRSDPAAPGERLLMLEANLETQARIADERDRRIQALEDTVEQLSTLVQMQQRQLAALGSVAPLAPGGLPETSPLTIARHLGEAPASPPPAWYRAPWLLAAGGAVALLGLLASLVGRRRRAQPAQTRDDRGR